MKTCRRCNERKSADAFSKQRSKPDGLQAYCRDCFRESRRARYQKDPDASRDRHLQNTYGVSLAEYENMLLSQGGTCALCGLTADEAHPGKRLAVDHCHDTGEVRGLCCSNCNRGLGLMRDNPQLLRRAAEYIEEHRR